MAPLYEVYDVDGEVPVRNDLFKRSGERAQNKII